MHQEKLKLNYNFFWITSLVDLCNCLHTQCVITNNKLMVVVCVLQLNDVLSIKIFEYSAECNFNVLVVLHDGYEILIDLLTIVTFCLLSRKER
jgi:hypothetical protein